MNSYINRGLIIRALFGGIFFIYIVRLFFLQVISADYGVQAQANDLEYQEVYPPRGIIYDRNENIYVNNSPIFDVMFIPKEIRIPDTTLLEELLGLKRETIRSTISAHKQTIAKFQWQPLATQLSEQQYARFSEQMWRFEGIKVVTKTARQYRYPAGAHFLGFINEVNQNEIDNAERGGDTTIYRYRPGDLVGKIGIEKQYEKLLRGKKGKKIILRDAFKREMGAYADGKYDEKPHAGTDIRLGVDAQLQVFGERLMQNKRGSIVAIEPSTGEILAFVSAPGYDPNLLTGSELGNNFLRLTLDKEIPLINRPLTAQYPPGSVFKILQALAALSQGVIDENTHFSCGGAWFRNKGKPACHGAHGSCGLPLGIKQSCNSFFAECYYTFLNHPSFPDIHDAYQRWHDIMTSYGAGRKLNVDLPDEKPGLVPTKEFYDKIYGKRGWGALTIYSNSIGQGEVLMTPLQMANTAALIANRGYYVPPHFLVARKGEDNSWIPEPHDMVKLPGRADHFQIVVDAMEQVVVAGTGTRARIDSVVVCGKTGTVENKAGEDHSVFIGFAPKDNPRIAIAAIVENAGFGGTWSAPICSLMMEHYLHNGRIKDQARLTRILEASFKNEVKPKAIASNETVID